MSNASTLADTAPNDTTGTERRRYPSVLAGLALVGVAAAHAQALPQATVFETLGFSVSGPVDPVHGWATEVNAGNYSYAQATSQSITVITPPLAVSPGVAQAEVQLALQPLPSVLAEASASVVAPAAGVPPGPASSSGPYGSSEASAVSRLFYHFEVFGPGPTANYDLKAVLADSAVSRDYMATGSEAAGSAGLFITDSGGQTVLEDALGFDFSTGAAIPFMLRQVGSSFQRIAGISQYSDNGVYTFQTGQIYTMEIAATADAHASSASPMAVPAGAQEASAFVDPSLTIDPSTPNASAYQLLISDGIGNVASVSPVPEPSTWAMLVLGMGSFGLRKLKQSREGERHDRS
jgi:hypothetical protein